MNLDWIRAHCMSLPHTTEVVQWEDHLLFKIGGKMYAIGSLNPAHDALSLKADPDEFDSLVEIPGIIPAPYMARNKWIQIQKVDVSWESISMAQSNAVFPPRVDDWSFIRALWRIGAGANFPSLVISAVMFIPKILTPIRMF